MAIRLSMMGAIAGLAPLMERRKADPTGVFRLLLLTDGEVTTGLKFEEVKDLTLV